MLQFYKTNVNPFKRKTGDCSTRALVQATNMKWDECIEFQCEKSIQTGWDTASSECIDLILKDFGFTKMKRPIGYKVKDMNELMGDDDIVVCRVSGHWVPIKQGYYIDSWDSGNKSVYIYWIKKDCSQKDLEIQGKQQKVRFEL